MATCYLSALWGAGAQLFDDDGVVLAGGFIKTYLAGTTTPSPTYTDSTGVTSNGVSIELDAAGRPPQELWIPTGVSLKFILTDADNVQVGDTYDNIIGIGDPGGGVSAGTSVWALFSGTPTYINGSSFSLTGDQTDTFPEGTRIKATVAGGTAYGTVDSSSYSSFTTIVIIPDSISLDAGLSAVSVSINDVDSANVSAAAVDYKPGITYPDDTAGAALNALGKYTTTAGTSTAYTLSPAIEPTAYAAGQNWLVKFDQASGANPTLNVSGLGAKDLKQYNSAGSKVDAVVYANQITNVSYDGTHMVVLDAIRASSLLRITTYVSNDTWTKSSDVSYIVVEAVGAGGGGYAGGIGGGGGGAGGFSKKLITSPPSTAAIVVGVGGAAGSPGAVGGDSSFATTTVVAKGGQPGTATNGGDGGSVTGAAGDLMYPGGGGGYGGAWVSQTFFGSGGNSAYGGGGTGGISRSTGVNGGANTGGGGSSGTAGGGAGGNGRVTVYEYA